MLRLRRRPRIVLLLPILLPILSTACAIVGMARLRITCCQSSDAQECGSPLPFADVLIDGVDVGACEDWVKGKYVKAGAHSIKIQRRSTGDGCCFDYTDEVALPRGGDVTVKAFLGRFPD